jgi:ABC-type glycerol-3-phosphate transport system substrate-binding protein
MLFSGRSFFQNKSIWRKEMLKGKKLLIACLALVLPVAAPLSAQPNIKDLGKPPAALKGMTIVMGNYWADYDTAKTPPTVQWNGSESQEKQLEWRKRIQSEFGFTMQEKNIAGWHEMPQVTATSIMAGRPAATVFVLQADWAMSLYKQNLIFPLSDSKAIDLTSKNKNVVINQMISDLFTFNKKTYALRTRYGDSQRGQVIFFNKRLFRESGLDPNLPYDLQKSGKWTWDEFLKICKTLTRDLNNDGIIDVYAMTADLSTEILDVFVAGNGAEYVSKDPKTGKLVNATGTAAFIEALQFMMNLYKQGVMMPSPVPQGAAWDWYKPMFNDGKVAMRFDQENVRQDIANMKDDWGMVLPPKGPRAKDYVVFTDENVMVIPRTFKKEEVDAILWAIQAWEADVNTRWQTSLYPVFRDIRAVDETMALIRDPKLQKFKNHILVPGLSRGAIGFGIWWYDGEPAQRVEAISQSWNARIEDANE